MLCVVGRAQLIEIVSNLHACGVSHSDLYPRNVLVDDNGTIRIIDFEHATFQDENEGAFRVGANFDTRYANCVAWDSVPLFCH